MPNVMSDQEEVQGPSIWQTLPDSILFVIFSFLPPRDLLTGSQVCKIWHRVAMDDYLWKELLYAMWKIQTSVPRAPGKMSWMAEFQRLYYHTPKVESEVLKEHRDQVLHVSFSNNGQMFATCSKDGYIKVWNATYPATVKYYEDMKGFTWKYTQFSQFNETDTHLLVSGVHFGSHSTSGEIAVFGLIGGFELQCRVLNKPYDIFGTWYNENYLLSGSLHWLGHLTSCSVLWLNKASQALESEHESVVMRLYKFRNINASSVRTIMIARCLDEDPKSSSHVTDSSPESRKRKGSQGATIDGVDTLHLECSLGKSRRCKVLETGMSQKMQMFSDGEHHIHLLEVDEDSGDLTGTIEYNNDYRMAESSIAQSRSTEEIKSDAQPMCVPSTLKGFSPAPSSEAEVQPSTSKGGMSSLPRESESVLVVDKAGPIASTSRVQESEDEASASQSEPTADRPESYAFSRIEIIPSLIEDSSQDTEMTEPDNTDSGELVITSTFPISHSDSCLHASQSSAQKSEDTTAMTLSKSQSLDSVGDTSMCSSGHPVSRAPSMDTMLPQNSSQGDKYLIFTTGMKTYTPHQIGIKRIKLAEAEEKMRMTTAPGPADVNNLAPNAENMENDIEEENGENRDNFDTVDHLIELHGHIIGMCLSPDHRYLYVNSRPWPRQYNIDDPLYPPPIAQEIDIHVIDLLTMHEVGTMHRAHKAYTPNDECFFIFLDVGQEYVASGAEDKHGYLWDRHYGACISRFPHNDVVNSVAFNPRDPEMLITASDDHSLKIWRSRHREKQVKGATSTIIT